MSRRKVASSQPSPTLAPVAPVPPERRCACGKIATIFVTWGKGVILYCDACDPKAAGDV